ncbi:ABC transporter permease subunit [Rhizobium beringeri]
MIEFTLWDILRNLLLATRWTILLSLVSFIGGGAVGLGLLFLRIQQAQGIQGACEILYRALPGHAAADAALHRFFGLGLFGIDVPAWLAAGLALTLWSAAFLAEIWRGCVEAVARGQWKPPPALAWGGCSRCATSSSRRR